MTHSVIFIGLISQAAKLGAQGTPLCRMFSLEELYEATNNFDTSLLMGEGSTGKVCIVVHKILLL